MSFGLPFTISSSPGEWLSWFSWPSRLSKRQHAYTGTKSKRRIANPLSPKKI